MIAGYHHPRGGYLLGRCGARVLYNPLHESRSRSGSRCCSEWYSGIGIGIHVADYRPPVLRTTQKDTPPPGVVVSCDQCRHTAWHMCIGYTILRHICMLYSILYTCMYLCIGYKILRHICIQYTRCARHMSCNIYHIYVMRQYVNSIYIYIAYSMIQYNVCRHIYMYISYMYMYRHIYMYMCRHIYMYISYMYMYTAYIYICIQHIYIYIYTYTAYICRHIGIHTV